MLTIADLSELISLGLISIPIIIGSIVWRCNVVKKNKKLKENNFTEEIINNLSEKVK